MSYIRVSDGMGATPQQINSAADNIIKAAPEIMKTIGPLAAQMMPMILQAVKMAGPAAMGVVNMLPIPPEAKKLISDILGQTKAPPPPPLPHMTVKKGVPTWVWIAGGVGIVGVVALATKKK